MDRRRFLKGLLATFAAIAIARNGVLQPDPERKWWDMGAAWKVHEATPRFRARWTEIVSEDGRIVSPWITGQATRIEIWDYRTERWVDITRWNETMTRWG